MDLRAAFDLATDLLAEQGPHDWSVRFDAAKKRVGVCKHPQRVIGLSAPLTRIHPESEVRETILHEIAHALVGPSHQHGEVWRRTAISIGSAGERCVPGDAPRLAGAWLGICPAGHTLERHKRPERVTTCSACSGRFDLAHVFEWTHHGRPASMHPNYDAELEAARRGVAVVRYAVGSRVRITGSSEFRGLVGTVIKRGRTSYHVQVPDGTLRVLFAAVEPA